MIRFYSSQAINDSINYSQNYRIDPLFITGLFDAEGSFVITNLKNPKLKTG